MSSNRRGRASIGKADPLELPRLLGERDFDRQALHAARAIEPWQWRQPRSMNSASSGAAIGPPWQSTMFSGRTQIAASAIRSISSTHRSRDFAEAAPTVPPTLTPICATITSAPARTIASASAGLEHVGRRQEVRFVCHGDHVDFEVKTESGLLEARAHDAVK